MKFKNWFKDFFKGAALGTGVLPGVSVGTVGLIVRIYDKLIDSINGLRKTFKQSFLNLLPIALGCVISAIVLLVIQEKLYSTIPFETTCLFAGFVLVGVPVVFNQLINKNLCKSDIFRIICGFFIATIIGVFSVLAKLYWNVDMSFAFENPNSNIWIYPVTLLVGFIAAVGCLLPGISGSMILFIFGLYNPIIGLLKGDNSIFHNTSRLGTSLILLVFLCIGILIGVFFISKTMKDMLEKHNKETLTWVIGFILGSFISMFVNQDVWDIYPGLSLTHILVGVVVVFTSFFSFYFLIKKFGK